MWTAEAASRLALLAEAEVGVAEARSGGAVELFANRRVSDGDERACTLRKAFAAELRHSVFSDDVLHHMTRGDNSGTLRKHRLYLGYALLRHRRDGNECLSALGKRATVHEIVLTTDSGYDTRAYRICAHLTGEIYLNS